MKPFVVNRAGRIVFPSNFFPELDFSVFATLEQFEAGIRRDFDEKAPTGTDILQRVEAGRYESRYELLRDVALNLFWVNRYAITMYDKRPTRWRDVPKRRDDLFIPVVRPWEAGDRKVAAVEACYRGLPPAWDGEAEDRIFQILFDAFRHRRHHATDLQAIRPTVAEVLANPTSLTFHLPAYDPDYPVYSHAEIIEADHAVPELEALLRRAMILHNQYPWDREQLRLTPIGEVPEDEYVVVFSPRTHEVLEFIQRVKAARPSRPPKPTPVEPRQPIAPFRPIVVRDQFRIMPRIEAIAVQEGEVACTNDDLIRNAAFSWSPMSAEAIRRKTGIEQRLYTQLDLEELALRAAEQALRHAGRQPEEIGVVLFLSCTTAKLMPSTACWLSGELGIVQTHASCDIVAACAGLPYGLAEGVRLLQEVERPVLVVCAEKFSDKIGNVRTSRMIFGDGAAALVLAPAPEGVPPDLEVFQTYASGPMSQVDSIIWPNPAFDNNITVYGPDVKALVARYLAQMIGELRALPHPDGQPGSMLEAIDLIVPHQANQTMVTSLAKEAGLAPEQLYFNIARVGNTSSASIPLAIFDAVGEGIIDRPMRVFAPGFGAGAVGGYIIMRIDPAVVARPIPTAVRHPLDETPARSTEEELAPAILFA